jgi:L-aspartate oxidase
MDFDRNGAELSTTLEAAHSHRRVLHAQDRTGGALVEALEARVLQRPGLERLQGALALQLWIENERCCGLQVLMDGVVRWIGSRAVVLATGGAAHLFANTTNPSQASGDGIAMAWRAGAVVRDLEFVQFHPTALMLPGAPHFLISEAVRGEGARLLDDQGASPVSHLAGADLAPRDAVSRALVQRMRERQSSNLWLDLRLVGRERLERQFPTILGRCRELGLEPTEVPIPVAPAAHYCMGGVQTNLQATTSLPGLFAVGEVASSGVHGANRLASNSLMECLVFARQLRQIELGPAPCSREAPLIETGFTSGELAPIPALETQINDLRDLCWRLAGVERQGPRLLEGMRHCRQLSQQWDHHPAFRQLDQLGFDQSLVIKPEQATWLKKAQDLRQRALVATLLMEAALFRAESRGGHFRDDFPAKQPFWQRHSVQRRGRSISTAPIGI